MRPFLFCLLSLILHLDAKAQIVCMSDDSTNRYEMPGTVAPPLHGAAVVDYGPYRIFIGGKIEDPNLDDGSGPYSCDMVVVDYATKKTYYLPLDFFPEDVAQQFSGVNYCYTFDKDTLWLMGGYGYDLTEGYETTFPQMTFFPVKTLIERVIQKKDFNDLFQVVDDRDLALTEGRMIRIDGYFFIYNGREIKPVKEEYTDLVTINEWDFKGQLRKFNLKNQDGFWSISEFQVCDYAEIFYRCMPGKLGGGPTVEYR